MFTDINEAAGAQLQAELGENASFVKHDVASEADWATVIAKAEERFGPVSVLGEQCRHVGLDRRPPTWPKPTSWWVCAVNQTSVFLGANTPSCP